MNKLWNAARYVLSSVPEEAWDAEPGDSLVDRWILSRASFAISDITPVYCGAFGQLCQTT